MQKALTVVLIALLSACDVGTGATGQASAGPPANQTIAQPNDDATALATWRANLQGRCATAIRTLAGANSPVPAEAQCACTLDRMMAGKTLAELEADERSGAQEEAFTTALRDCMMVTPFQSGR